MTTAAKTLSATNPPGAAGSGRLGLWALTALAIGLLVVTMVLMGVREHRRALADAAELSARRADRLAQDLAQSLDLAEQSILHAEARLLRLPPGSDPAGLFGGDARERAELMARLPLPFELHALGRDGHPLTLNPDPGRHGDPLSDHAHALPPGAVPGRWYVGLTDGTPASRRVPLLRVAPPGPHGVIAFSVDFDHAALMRHFAAIAVPGGGVALFRIEADGGTTVLAREPFNEAELGRRVQGPLAQGLARGPKGTFDSVTQLDGMHRIVSFRRLDGDAADLVVAYGMLRASALARWREQLPAGAAVVLLLSAAMLWGGWRLDRAWHARAQAGELLVQGEQRLRTLTDNLPDVVVRLDRAGRHLFANAAVERATGLPSEAFIGKTNAELGMPADRVALWMACLQRVLASGQAERLEFEYPGPDGLWVWESQVTPEPTPPGGEPTVLVISRDITERRLAREALQLSEQRLREAQELAAVGSWAHDQRSGQVEWSDEAFRIFGLDRERDDASYERFLALVHPEDRAAVDEVWQRSVAERRDYDSTHRLLLADGRVKHVHERGRCIYADDGTPLHAQGTVQDITARVLAEQALRSSEASHREMFEHNPHPMWVYDVQSLAFLAVNQRAVDRYGYSRDEFLRMTLADIRPPEDLASLNRSVAGAPAGFDDAGTWRHLLRDGRVLEVEITSHGLDFGGRAARLVLAHDVTRRNQAERALRDSEERLRLALQAANQGLYDLDLRTGRAVVGPEYATMLGFDPVDFHETHAAWLERMHPDDRGEVERTYEDYVAGRRPDYRVEFRQLTRGGGWKWILSVGRIQERAADGTPLRMLGTHTDLDPVKAAQAAELAATRRFETLFDAAPEAISVSDLDSARFLQVNDAFCELFGHPREQVIGRTSVELALWLRAPTRDQVLQRLRDGEAVQGEEGVARRADGQSIDVMFSAERIEFGGGDALLLIFRDISERKRLEAARRASEVRLIHLLARAPTVIYTARPDGDFAATYYSPNLLDQMGWQPQDFVSDPGFWLEHVHPEDRDAVLQQLSGLATRDELALEYRFRHADGRWRWVRDQVSVVRAADGVPVELVGAWIDITERKEAEEQARRLAAELEQRVVERTAQLARSEQRFRAIFETVPVSIGEEDWSGVQRLLRGLREQGVENAAAYFAARPEFVKQCLQAVRVQHMNRKALALHDIAAPSATLPGLSKFFPGAEDLSQFVGELEAMWEGKPLFTAKRSLPSITGRPLSLMVTMSLPALDAADGTALVCLVDITELDRLNAELDRSVARLRDVNRELETFTYSVSHDLKAPLRGIDGYSRLLLAEHAERLDGEALQFLGHIRRATQHMGALIDDLLAYSRLERRELARADVPLLPVVDTALAGMRSELDAAGAELVLALDPALRVYGDPQGLTMALRNLIDNALKFSRQRTPPVIGIEATRTQGGVAVTVTDNGVGFDMKFHERIFAIFQRLHRAEDYPGTGIGLAIVRKAVERMGGRVWASSRPGAGASFTIELPRPDDR